MAADFETTSFARRALALLVDWAACTLVVSLFVPVFGAGNSTGSLLVLLVYVVESALLTAASGGSFGKLVTRLRVVRADGDPRPPDLVRALLRQVMVALVIPPLVFRSDGRGLHDIASGTATVELSTFLTLRDLARGRTA